MIQLYDVVLGQKATPLRGLQKGPVLHGILKVPVLPYSMFSEGLIGTTHNQNKASHSVERFY